MFPSTNSTIVSILTDFSTVEPFVTLKHGTSWEKASRDLLKQRLHPKQKATESIF